MNAQSPPAVGSFVGGRYRVEGVIGTGGMGVVLRAVQVDTGRPVAVKVLTGDATRSPDAVARFEQEVHVAAQLRSDHVVSVVEVGRAPDGAAFLVMELLDGVDLASLIERRAPMPLSDAVGLILQACAGVAAAHAAGLVHRDLKPANLFLARRHEAPPIVKVLDFGLSKIVVGAPSVGLTQTQTAIGTPMYMAPEQVMSTKHVDARCDQHALGMVLYELVTRHPPYEHGSASALAVAIATHPPPSARMYRADVPEALDAAIRRALAKQPDERFADLGELARALEPFAPPGAAALTRSIEEILRPLRAARSDPGQAERTIEMALPDALLRSFDAPRATAGGFPHDPARGVVVTASPVASDRRVAGGSPTSPKLALLLLGIAVGATLVVVSLAVAASRWGWMDAPRASDGATSPSDPRGAAAERRGAGAGDAAASAVPSPAPTGVAPSSPQRPGEGAAPATRVSGAPSASVAPSASAPPPAASPPRPRPRTPRRPPSKRDPLKDYD